MQSISLRTHRRCELLDITPQVQNALDKSGLTDGAVSVYVPHTTAGVTINENADPSVVADLLNILERLVPESGGYRHPESRDVLGAHRTGHQVADES